MDTTLRTDSPASPPAQPTDDDIEAVILAATSAHTTGSRDTRTQLFVGNLPYRVRWQDLKDLFRKAGTVLRADVSLGPDNRSRGYGTVLLASAEDAGCAVDMFNGYSWQTRVLEVRPDRMPSDIMSGAGDMGYGMSGGYGSHPNSAPMSTVASPFGAGTPMMGMGPMHHGEPADSLSFYGHDRPASTNNVGKNLFVGNLPFHCQWQDLKDLFRQAGTIMRADVALGPDSRSRGFGTVIFANEMDSDRALKMFNGYEYNGRVLKVHYDKYNGMSTHVPPSPSHLAFSDSLSSMAGSSYLRASDLYHETLSRQHSSYNNPSHSSLGYEYFSVGPPTPYEMGYPPGTYAAHGQQPQQQEHAQPQIDAYSSYLETLANSLAATSLGNTSPLQLANNPSKQPSISSPPPGKPADPVSPSSPTTSTSARSSTRPTRPSSSSRESHPAHPGHITIPPPLPMSIPGPAFPHPSPHGLVPLHSPPLHHGMSPMYMPVGYQGMMGMKMHQGPPHMGMGYPMTPGLPPMTPSMPPFTFLPPPQGSPYPGYNGLMTPTGMPSPLHHHPPHLLSPSTSTSSTGMSGSGSMNMPLYSPFSPGVIMSPGALWGRPGNGNGHNPFINPAVGAPVHVGNGFFDSAEGALAAAQASNETGRGSGNKRSMEPAGYFPPIDVGGYFPPMADTTEQKKQEEVVQRKTEAISPSSFGSETDTTTTDTDHGSSISRTTSWHTSDGHGLALEEAPKATVIPAEGGTFTRKLSLTGMKRPAFNLVHRPDSDPMPPTPGSKWPTAVGPMATGIVEGKAIYGSGIAAR